MGSTLLSHTTGAFEGARETIQSAMRSYPLRKVDAISCAYVLKYTPEKGSKGQGVQKSQHSRKGAAPFSRQAADPQSAGKQHGHMENVNPVDVRDQSAVPETIREESSQKKRQGQPPEIPFV